MKHLSKFLFLFLLTLSINAQDHDRDTYANFIGLTQDVKHMEEAIYEFNEKDSTTQKVQYRIVDLNNGRITKDQVEYFGEYPNTTLTLFIYSPIGQLIKKEIKDLTYNTSTSYNYEYSKDKLITENYFSEFSNTITSYKYDSQGRVIRRDVKNQDGTDSHYTEFFDFGAENDTYTEKNYFYGDSGVSFLGTSKYIKGKIVSYESSNETFGDSKFEYEYDANGNKISDIQDGEIAGTYKYEYVGKNYTKSYYLESYSDYSSEDFSFRKITFANGKTIGSTEPDMNFIYQNNIIDVSYNEDYSGENLAELLNGECVSGDCQNGYGTENYDAGQTYEGFFQDGERHGSGVLNYGDGSSYNGMWENGFKKGLGMYNNGDGNYFLGYHKDDLRNGYGFEQNVLDNGEYEFVPSMWEDGNLIEEYSFAPTGNTTGCINGDCNNGHGRMVFDNGDVYLGYFKNGKFDKFGVYVYKIGDTYIGGYSNHERSGLGMYVWANKSVYIGTYSNDTYNGLGAYLSNEENSNLIGEFKDGRLVKSME